MTLELHLEEDTAGARAVARLRLVSAIIAFLGGGTLAALRPGPLGFIVAALALVAGFIWFWLYFRAQRSGFAGGATLAIDGSGLHMALESDDIRVEWAEVLGAEVDEDRLVLLVHRRGAPPLSIPPIFRGMGLHELADVIEQNRQDAALSP